MKKSTLKVSNNVIYLTNIHIQQIRFRNVSRLNKICRSATMQVQRLKQKSFKTFDGTRPAARGQWRDDAYFLHVKKLDVVAQFGADLEGGAADGTSVRPLVAVVLEVRTHTATRRVRLAAQRTSVVRNAYEIENSKVIVYR